MRQGLVFSIVVLAVFCAPALAYDWSTNPGDGSPENPYQIGTPEQLNAIGADTAYMYIDTTLWQKHFKLMNDIDMSSLGAAPHNTIGNNYNPFTGIFDGNGYRISNLRVNLPNHSYVGLFGVIGNAEIKHLGLENVHITGNTTVGGLAGENRGSITGCSVEGTISGNNNVGGLVGRNFFDGTISDCSTAGHIFGNNEVGGLIGYNREYVTIIDCYSHCDISTTGQDVGGIIGMNFGGRIANCYTTGSVTAYSHLGGLVGDTASYSSAKNIIENSYATGDVSGHDRVGGLVGDNGSTLVRNCYATGSVTGVNHGVGGLIGTNYRWPTDGPHGPGVIENCYSTGKVTGVSRTGGLVGHHWNQSMEVYNSFWDSQTSGWTSSSGGTGRTTAQMQARSTFTTAGWNFSDIWAMGQYPVLRWELSPLQPLIDAAQDGDVIIVEPGVYNGRLYMKGKNITLTSIDPIDPNVVAATVLQGIGVGAVITFDGTENETCLLEGFTITDGYSTAPGGGICGNDSMATIRNCVFQDNTAAGRPGGGIWGIGGTISHCIFENNRGNAGGGLARCSGVISNCLVVNNTAGTSYGSALHNCDGLVRNCTLVNDSNSVTALSLIHISDGVIDSCIMQPTTGSVFSNSTAVTQYCCYPGAAGEGDIDVEPMFIDPNNGDFGLLSDSPCINAGDPNYVSELNETDLGGNARFIGPAVDIGCYEFPNTAPVADAGVDQVVYAWVDGYAMVTLDGTGSNDADGDELAYFWYDGNDLIAEGAEPNVVLPVGEHVIDLIVNDGIEDSQADACGITVVDPFEALAGDIIELVQHGGIANSLLAKVDAALKKLEDGNENNDGAAVGSLQAFINAVNAQRGKKISEDDADSLITVAEQIINML